MSIQPTKQNRTTQKKNTRRRIIDTAFRVFARDGIIATSTATIAKEAGLSHGSMFAHFGARDALIMAVIEDFGEVVSSRLHELIGHGARTKEVLEAHMKGIREHEDFYARVVVEAPLLSEGARQSLALIQSSICFHLSPAVEADTRAGIIKPMPLHLLFNTWIGLLHHYLVNRELFAPGASVIDRRGAELVEHFISLISKEETDERESDAILRGGGPRGGAVLRRPN
jgi:AcrR family transcriptional regulator